MKNFTEFSELWSVKSRTELSLVFKNEIAKSPFGNLYFETTPPEEVVLRGITKTNLPLETETLSGLKYENKKYSFSLAQFESSNVLNSSIKKSELKTPANSLLKGSLIHEPRNKIREKTKTQKNDIFFLHLNNITWFIIRYQTTNFQ
jgi:phage terminase large subunit-like protein